MGVNIREYSDHYAYDISKNVISKGEIFDKDVLSQSIEMVLCTMFSERLFNPSFGSVLPSYIFDFINKDSGEKLLDDIIDSIKVWENRVKILERDARLQILYDEHAIILTLPYIINQLNIPGIFKKKISF
jgi:phage baseplate assembly protein W